jgi:hypothetical protein
MKKKYSEYKRRNTLFHYTNAKGLKGILKTNSLWATSYHCANDLSEYIYTLEMIKSKMNELNEPHNNQNLNTLLSLYSSQIPIENYINAIKVFDFAEYMSTSFSYTKNRYSFEDGQLNQWRNYGDYAICFDKKRLEKSVDEFIREKVYIKSSRVIYGAMKNKRLLEYSKKYLEPFLKNYRNRLKIETSYIDNFYKPPTKEIVDFLEMAAFTKNPHFSEENEYRIYVQSFLEDNQKSFIRNGLIVPYETLSVSVINCIDRIIIGPSSRSDDRVRSVKALLKSCIEKHNLKNIDIDVTASNIPFNRE